ncbi:MAG: hypothetical protein H6610_01985 [Ignavibacteriales bacterium]|nr:hypothetical protein [Ignavibacteriales bacterium]MCB9218212.1 hypothetical protein [Ignavibacteriales bacterium]MCB9260713.1 hypothetical protein [Ignavibacteriales bacterium]
MFKYSYNKFLILFLLSTLLNLNAQNRIDVKKLKSNFVISENKEKYYSNLVKNVNTTFSETAISNSELWVKALRDAQSIFLKNNLVESGIQKSLTQTIDINLKLQRVTLEVAYSLYQNNFSKEVLNIFEKTQDPISFAISALYLQTSDISNSQIFDFDEILKQKFPNYDQNSILINLKNELTNNNSENISEAQLKDLLNHNFQNGKTIVYSIHRKNRIYPGIAIIKKTDGNFLKNDDGTIFNIQQLALSYSNLPGYIPNGNTPQGVYSIVGWYISPTETIGPTPNLLVRSPFEVSTEIFYHGKQKKNSWNFFEYIELLPESLQNYHPLFETYNAGKSGRKLIIAHGSTDETKYYKDQPYYPLTPTRGCLSSKEIWSESTGYCIESDQAKLINAYKSVGNKNGFLVVFELDNQNKPVTIEEISKLLDR